MNVGGVTKTLSLLIVLTLFVSGCISSPSSQQTPQQKITCNSPYILVGTSCCLDQNSNNICDSDESISEEKTKTSQLEFSLEKLELTVKKGTVTRNNDLVLKNIGDSQTYYFLLCNPPHLSYQGEHLNKYKMDIPNSGLKKHIECSHAGASGTNIQGRGSHVITVSYFALDDDPGTYKTTLIAVDSRLDAPIYSIEIPLIINVVE